jgi:hypothetical protein
LEYVRKSKGRRTHGTCTWLVARSKYTAWLGADNLQLLHITGNPGIGKSVMSTFLINELHEKAKTTKLTLAYYFCDNKDDRRNTASCLVRGLLLQLLRQQPKLFRHVLNEYAYKKDKLFTDFNDMWRMFISVLKDEAIGRVYLLIDALDECTPPSSESFLSSLKEFLEQKSARNSNLHILITSRPERRILDNISPDHYLQMDSAKINSDLTLYIDEKVNQLARNRKYSASLKNEVRSALVNRSGGTFLWVSLVIQDLAKTTVTRLVKEKLRSLPKSLEEIYERIISEISSEELPFATLTLQLLVAAKRPLSRQELATAIVMHGWKKATLPSQDQIEEAADDFTCCQSLLYVDVQRPISGDDSRGQFTVDLTTINFIHQSVKDYLIRQHPSNLKAPIPVSLFKDLDFLMFEICWKYLSAREFDHGHMIIKKEHGRLIDSDVRGAILFRKTSNLGLLQIRGFTSYAISEWIEHARDFSPSVLSHSFWSTTDFNTVATLRDRLLLLVSEVGIVALVGHLVEKGADIKERR